MASRVVHRLHTPAALALVLALAGSTPAATRPEPMSSTLGAVVAAAPATPQPYASATLVDPSAVSVLIESQEPEPAVRIAATGAPVGSPVHVDIADVLLDAYRAAVAGAPVACHLPVSLLAAIGQVESGSLAGRSIDAQHRTSVLGPVLDGNGFAAIPDTDDGAWDGDATWDRAVGPMQFIPSTWRSFGADGDGDGVAHPQDVEDAAAGAAAYLCYGARDLSRPEDMRSAILSYNHSEAYLRLVTTYQQRYAALGLDGGASVTGLPTSISLVATAADGPGRWEAAELVARENAKARGDRAAGTETASATRRSGAASGSATQTSRPTSNPAPSQTPTPTATSTPSPSPSSPSPSSPSPSDSPSPSESPSQTPTTTPTTTPGADPTTSSPDDECPPPSGSPTPTTGQESSDECDPCAPPEGDGGQQETEDDPSAACQETRLSEDPSATS